MAAQPQPESLPLAVPPPLAAAATSRALPATGSCGAKSLGPGGNASQPAGSFLKKMGFRQLQAVSDASREEKTPEVFLNVCESMGQLPLLSRFWKVRQLEPALSCMPMGGS